MNASADEFRNQPTVAQPEPKLARYFIAMTKAEASDLYLKSGSPAHFRVGTVMHAVRGDALGEADVVSIAEELLRGKDKQRQEMADYGGVDLAYQIKGGDRFRINIYRERGRISVAVRRVTRDIPDFETLHLPAVLARITEHTQGLILVSGPTGGGKSTTIASMLELINKTRACHIVTIEDPIEYLYEDKKAIVSQREVGIDVPDFEIALRHLMRQAPDVVLVGEMRDHETFRTAVQAAETGHLVFGTIHASQAPQTISRVLALFPVEGRGLIRQSLVHNLCAIICQRLLPSVLEDVDCVPAVEILTANPAVRKYIQDGKEGELADVIRSEAREGMQTFSMSLLELIEKDYVAPAAAYEAAPNPEELKMLVRGITSGHIGRPGR
ncbi:MAG: PilT/PilU family type 4a pilus ATPase [Phycisphaerae bacterium]|nr:PilT/PilU family type 4a pilus ATPase [Phycisphaerae bacterium]